MVIYTVFENNNDISKILGFSAGNFGLANLVKCKYCDVWRPGVSSFHIIIPLLQPTASSPAHRGRHARLVIH